MFVKCFLRGMAVCALVLVAQFAPQLAHAIPSSSNDPVTFDAAQVQFFGEPGKNGQGDVAGYFEWQENSSTSGSFFASLTNTTDTDDGGFLTGFGFFLPDAITPSLLSATADAGKIQLQIFTVSSSNTCTEASSTCDATQVTRSEFTNFDLVIGDGVGGGGDFFPGLVSIGFGGALGGNVTGGGSPNNGIGIDNTGVFEFLFTDHRTENPGLSFSTSSFVPDTDNFWCARWRGMDETDGNAGSDAQCGVIGDTTTDAPEPATIALFGIGLVGLGAIARRRRKAA